MIPVELATIDERHKYIRQNKGLLYAAKKSLFKHADAVDSGIITIEPGGDVSKALPNPEVLTMDEFAVRVVINTTNFMDSHDDVHLPGLWKKTLAETRAVYHLKEHKMTFENVISDRVNASTKTLSWSQIGYNYPGVTEALIFDSIIEKERNPYMAQQYAKGRVINHSVGMRYVQIALAMNSTYKEDAKERETWDRYINEIVNRDKADELGYFWVVTEARMFEGSAVLIGSNQATPTIQITPTKAEPAEAEVNTSEASSADYNKMIELFKSLKTKR